jgi:mono/diheme cytochrome c family protein
MPMPLRTYLRVFVVGTSVAAAPLLAAVPVAAAGQAAQASVTFTKDIAPILQNRCQNCHRPGDMAPMSLVKYEDVRPWVRSIKARVAAREMPPWHIDRNIGIQKFKGDPSLTDKEIATIVAWVDAGAPMGNPADMPPPRTFEDDDKWHIGTPDLIIRSPKRIVKAYAADWFGDDFVPSGLTEDRYIKAIETKPSAGSREVVHHLLTYAVDPEDNQATLGDDSTGGGLFLNEYASGKNGDIFPDGAATLLKAGSNIRFSLHLHSIGREVASSSEIGIVFYPKGYVPKYTRWSKQLAINADPLLDIPAGVPDVRHDSYERINQPAKLVAFQPHMHIRGKAQCLELIYPDNRVETISCAHFNYNWHLVYPYADEVQPLVPAGTVLHVISWHDNSAGNKYNPDPKNWVGRGNRTIDEMGFAWITWYDLTEEQYKEELAARKAARAGKATVTNDQSRQQ